MRIVSLLPAATEWIAAFGGLGELVGRSHACDHPPSVQRLPVLTRPAHRDRTWSPRGNQTPLEPTWPTHASSGADRPPGAPRPEEGLSPFDVDVDLLVRLGPDIVVTQTQCAACAVTPAALRRLTSERFDPVPELFSMQAHTMRGVLKEAVALGRAIDRTSEAIRVVSGLERRLRMLRDRLGLDRRTATETLPSVTVLEWLDPLVTAGHWTPDLIEMAGGRPVCSAEGGVGGLSEVRCWHELVEADPDVIAVAPCSVSLDETRQAVARLEERDEWRMLRAVRCDRVYLFDGNAYFNRPGPRLYRSIELLSAAIYGDRAGIAASPGEMMRHAT